MQCEAAERERECSADAKLNTEGENISGLGEGQNRTKLMIEKEEKLNQLEERERSIRQLVSDITDVNTIFNVKMMMLK